MIKSVNIDGEDHLIRSCVSCPFHDFHNSACKHPKLEDYVRRTADTFPEVCPLGLVKDCFSCKHDGQQQSEDFRCEGCEVWFHADTGVEDPPTKWEVKE